MKKFHNRKGGFTLIELMIVVAIIGILAAIAIPNFLRFQLKAKSSEGKTNLAAIRTAEESYYSEFGVYVSALASPRRLPWDKNQDGVRRMSIPTVADAGFDRLGLGARGLRVLQLRGRLLTALFAVHGHRARRTSTPMERPDLGLQEGWRCWPPRPHL